MTRRGMAVCVIVLVAACAFANALPNAFLGDDLWIVDQIRRADTLGETLRAFRPQHWARHHPSPSNAYRPLRTLSFALDYRVWGLRPFGYHLTNLALHLIATALVACVCQRWLGNRAVTLATTLLFAAHPLHVEAVAYAKNRAEPLAAIFVLLGMFPLIGPNADRSRRLDLPRLAFSLACFVIAVFGKETALAMPVLAMVVLVTTGSKVWKAGPLWGMLAAYLVWRAVFLPSETVVPHRRPPDQLRDRPIVVAETVGQYGRLFGWPRHLCVHRAFPPANAGADLIACAVLIALVFVRREKMRAGMLWFFAAIVPSANIVYQIWRPIAEQRMYLPSIGLCIALAALICGRTRHRCGFGLICTLALMFFAGTISRNFAWADEFTLQRRAARVSPRNPKVHRDLAKEYSKLGNRRGTLRHAAWAVRTARRWERDVAHFELGRALEDSGQLEKALIQFGRAVACYPQFAEAMASVGRLAARLGELPRAEEALRRAIELDPELASARSNLAGLLLETNRPREAVAEAKRALETDPAGWQAHWIAARAYETLGQKDAANEHLRRAEQLRGSALE